MSKDMSRPLTDAEWAQMKKDHEDLQAAIAKHGAEKIKQAAKDAIQLPSKRGDLND